MNEFLQSLYVHKWMIGTHTLLAVVVMMMWINRIRRGQVARLEKEVDNLTKMYEVLHDAKLIKCGKCGNTLWLMESVEGPIDRK